MSRALKSEQRERISWSCCQRAFGKPDILGVGSYERNNDGQALSVVVVCNMKLYFRQQRTFWLSHFLVDEKNSHTISPGYAGLRQAHYGE